MAKAVRLRVNVGASFPTQVFGANAITVGRQNGVYTIKSDYPSTALLTAADPAKQMLVYDPLTGVYSRLALSTLSQSGQSIDVFAIGGQSNAQGNLSNAALSPVVPPGKVLQWNGSAVVPGNDPIGVPGSVANPASAWPAFGLTYYAATGRNVLFVGTAVGGTKQCGAIAPYGSNVHWDAGTNIGGLITQPGTLIQALVSNVNSAMAAARSSGFIPAFRGVLWSQGEDDASFIGGVPPTTFSTSVTGGPYGAGSTSITVASASGLTNNNTAIFALDNSTFFASAFTVSGSTLTLVTPVPASRTINTGALVYFYGKTVYRYCLQSMINYLRTTTIDGGTFPQLPFYISTTGQSQGQSNTQQGFLSIRQAQEEVCASDAYSRVVYRGAQDFSARNMIQAGGLHYLQEGYNEMGREMAKGVLAAQVGDDAMAQPNYSVWRVALGGTPRIGDQLLVTVTHPAMNGGAGVGISANVAAGETLTSFAARFVRIEPFLPALQPMQIFLRQEGASVVVYQPVNLFPQATVSASWTTSGSTETATVTSGVSAYNSAPGRSNWHTFAPVLTPAGGSSPSITTGGSAAFLREGKKITVSINAKVSAISGSPTSVTLQFPVAPVRNTTFHVQVWDTTGLSLGCLLTAGQTTSDVLRVASSGAAYAPQNADQYVINAVYEAA